MTRLTLQVDEDHLKQLVRGPKSGLAELIWNALDADANNVIVTTEETPLNAVSSIKVSDDGHGITPDDIETGFGALGGSWKRTEKVSRGEKRQLHGKQGQGRFSAFGLGNRVKWTSVFEETPGENREVQIIGQEAQLDGFDVSEPLVTNQDTGTVVEIDFVPEKVAKFLDHSKTTDSLTAEFAIYLEQYTKASICYRGNKLDPGSLQKDRIEYPLDVEGVQEKPVLLIIEWNKPVDRALYMCTASGMALGETKAGIQAPTFEFTAYIKWDGFSDYNFLLAELGAEPLSSVVDTAREKLKQHFKEKMTERKRAVVQEWVQEGVYPYSTSPTTLLEEAERHAFEVVAYAAASSVNGGDTSSKKLSLRLLKEALEANPGNLHNVLASVLSLPEDKLAELNGLLNKTTLSSIISTAKLVSDRLTFLSGLDTILFDAEPRRQTLERRQLHRILANETWIFGEEFALVGDDEPLTKVLRKYLEHLGEDVELADTGPVLHHDGTKPIPDLVLSRQSEHAENYVSNLVVELKRPSVVIGDEEISQITKYALAVTRDERFNRPNVSWKFWVISNVIDEMAEDRRTQVGLPFGCAQRTPKYEVWVFTWSEIIANARHRLKFVEKKLNFTATHDDGLEYLRKTHAKYLPPVLAAPQLDSDSSTDAA